MSHSIKITFCLLFVMSVLAQPDEKVYVPLDESDKEADLDVLVLDSHGRRLLEQPSIKLGQLFKGNWIDLAPREFPVRLKYGTYRLSVRHAGFYPVEKTFRIRNPSQALMVVLFPARGGIWDNNTIQGRLMSVRDKPGCQWIRLISPFGDSAVAEAKVSESGYFLFEDVPPGRYMAVTIGIGSVCDIFDVVISDQRLQDLALPAPKNKAGHD